MSIQIQSHTYKLDEIKAVLLVGNPDFGRCPVASRLHRALWPVAGKPVLQRLIEHIFSQGIRRFVLCGEQNNEQIRQHLNLPNEIELEFQEERLPRGTAGCLRDAADPEKDKLLFLFHGCMLAPPDLNEMICEHRQSKTVMTVFLNPERHEDPHALSNAQLYVFEPEVLRFIPEKGYLDIKEGLVPDLIKKDYSISAVHLQKHTGGYRTWPEYILALNIFLSKLQMKNIHLEVFHKQSPSLNIWLGKDVILDPSVKIVGPVLIGDHAVIEENCVIFGPAIIESNVHLGSNSVIADSVIWSWSTIGNNCEIQGCLVDANVDISKGCRLHGTAYAPPKSIYGKCVSFLHHLDSKPSFNFGKRGNQGQMTLHEFLVGNPFYKNGCLILLLLFGGLITIYWNPTLHDLWRVWTHSDEYSSGLLVPLLAGYILWNRRTQLSDCSVCPSYAAIGVLAGAQILRFLGLYYYFSSAERVSFVLSIGALAWILLGFQFLKKVKSIWLYLFLMLPLPHRLESFVTLPLQKWATVTAVFGLETLGYHVVREGNIININGSLVAVAEACNGLRMLTAFFVVSGLVALLTHRKKWEKLVVILSSIPIALFCNTLRLIFTAIAFTILDAEIWEKRFHDYGGLAMMPLALLIIVFELWFLSKMVVSTPEPQKQKIVFRRN